MDFSFTEEEELLRKNIREFAQAELAPTYTTRAKKEGKDPVVWKKLADMGILGLGIPEEFGGQGDLDPIAMGIVLEEIAYADFNVAFQITGTVLQAQYLVDCGDPSIRGDMLSAITKGDLTIGFSLTEPHCGNDALAIKTTAIRDGDDYVLNGEKTACSDVWAPYHVVVVKTDPDAGPRGMSALVVPLDESKGGLTRSIYSDIGMKPISRGAMTFKNYRVPAKYLIGEEGIGFFQASEKLSFARALVPLKCLAAGRAALDAACEYTKQRTAFGNLIAKYEGVTSQLAEDYTLIEAARLLCYRVLWKKKAGLKHNVDASMTKWWGPEVALMAIQHSMLTQGHPAYCDDIPAAQQWVDVAGQQYGDGTRHVHLNLIARGIIGKEAKAY
jgi:cyclohexanecarboxyl-CoA dehydrogenase